MASTEVFFFDSYLRNVAQVHLVVAVLVLVLVGRLDTFKTHDNTRTPARLGE